MCAQHSVSRLSLLIIEVDFIEIVALFREIYVKFMGIDKKYCHKATLTS